MCNRRIMLTALACTMLLVSVMAPAQHRSSSDSIAGEWKITFTIAGQTASGTIAFHVDGNKLMGRVETAHTGAGTLQEGSWSEGKLSAKCVFEKHESIALAGELKDGKLSGTFHTEGMDGTWEATPAAKTAP